MTAARIISTPESSSSFAPMSSAATIVTRTMPGPLHVRHDNTVLGAGHPRRVGSITACTVPMPG